MRFQLKSFSGKQPFSSAACPEPNLADLIVICDVATIRSTAVEIDKILAKICSRTVELAMRNLPPLVVFSMSAYDL